MYVGFTCVARRRQTAPYAYMIYIYIYDIYIYIYIYDIYIYIYIYDTSDISQHDILRAAASPFRVARVAGKS